MAVAFNGDDRFRLIEIGGIATGKQAGCELVGNGVRQGMWPSSTLRIQHAVAAASALLRQLRQGFETIVFGFEQDVA